MKKNLLKTQLGILKSYGLVFFHKVSVCWFDPYSISPNPSKTYWLLENAWLRLHPDGKVTIESLEHSYFIPKELAENQAKEGIIPLFHIEYSDIYETKLEAELARKPVIPVPEKIEVGGAVIPYGSQVLPSLILHAIDKFGNGKATPEKVIDYLTTPTPNGGGWFKRTLKLINKVKTTLPALAYKGMLDYNEETGEYQLVTRKTSTELK